MPLPPAALSHAEVIDHSRQECARAKELCEKARASLTRTSTLESNRTHWRAIWKEACTNQWHILRTCAYCGRMAGRDGDWMAVNPKVAQALPRSKGINLSHGICPDCIARYKRLER